MANCTWHVLLSSIPSQSNNCVNGMTYSIVSGAVFSSPDAYRICSRTSPAAITCPFIGSAVFTMAHASVRRIDSAGIFPGESSRVSSTVNGCCENPVQTLQVNLLICCSIFLLSVEVTISRSARPQTRAHTEKAPWISSLRGLVARQFTYSTLVVA